MAFLVILTHAPAHTLSRSLVASRSRRSHVHRVRSMPSNPADHTARRSRPDWQSGISSNRRISRTRTGAGRPKQFCRHSAFQHRQARRSGRGRTHECALYRARVLGPAKCQCRTVSALSARGAAVRGRWLRDSGFACLPLWIGQSDNRVQSIYRLDGEVSGTRLERRESACSPMESN
jgi:hypothetical protein